jgi:RNA polymerase sigma-70 factor (ECF subfamily)
VLDPDVVWTSDGGGRATASRKPVYGADRVGRAWIALGRKSPDAQATPIELNGRMGLLIAGADGDRAVLSLVVDGGRITRIDAVRNPEKLHRLAR